ncbi:hypothetical protein EG028_26970 [Chitinophaga barathri]|uniref:Uncharacterized protein n=1 Tax=Chitinophaga barathri TaxID=1647451 RepID=A0A3N4M513_9BACT|nr:hypothetical protein EG028_26970 [Chitinophaga barathri]
MDVILRVLIMVVLSYPGAFIVWLFKRRKKSFKEIKEEGSAYTHAMITSLLIGLIAVLIECLRAIF